jgi:hypothetical protein
VQHEVADNVFVTVVDAVRMIRLSFSEFPQMATVPGASERFKAASGVRLKPVQTGQRAVCMC